MGTWALWGLQERALNPLPEPPKHIHIVFVCVYIYIYVCVCVCVGKYYTYTYEQDFKPPLPQRSLGKGGIDRLPHKAHWGLLVARAYYIWAYYSSVYFSVPRGSKHKTLEVPSPKKHVSNGVWTLKPFGIWSLWGLTWYNRYLDPTST